MSERGYFSLRYSIPGYTFILLVIAINYVPLSEILKTEGVSGVFGAFLAFLSLVSGSALGFLISQFYYLRSMQKNGLFESKEVRDLLEEILIKEYRLDKEKLGDEKAKIRFLGAVADFIRHSRKKEDLIIDYTGRRWDMHHIFSCTLYSLGIGSLAGMLLRIYFQIFLFKSNFSIPDVNVFANVLAEFIALTALFVFVLVLGIVIWVGRSLHMYLYLPLLEAFYRYELKHDSGRYLKEVFPPEYFTDSS